jgi:thiamine biosynthesis lipoprotein
MKKGVELDLGGLGKGFTADEVMKLLQFHGVSSALIDMGGDICVSDPPPDKAHWVLAFSYYDEEGKEVIQKIKLKNGAVATSGDLYQFVEIDGKRYSHIVNPITGWALTNRIQVTVIADKATRADAFASAFSVLGIEKTKSKYRDLVNLEVFMVEENGKQGYGQWSSPSFTSTKEQ